MVIYLTQNELFMRGWSIRSYLIELIGYPLRMSPIFNLFFFKRGKSNAADDRS